MMEMLIKNGADVNAINNKSNSALTKAIFGGSFLLNL